MKLKKFLFIGVISMCLVGCANQSDNEFDGTCIDINFDVSNSASFKINPFIYGTFIEHIETCIYNGLWSEVILDRKFYKPIGEDVSQRTIVEGDISYDDSSVFEGDYSPILHKGSKIRQIGLSLDAKKYNGYLYAKGHGTLKISYTFDDELISKDLNINSNDFEKYEYSIDVNKQSNKYKLAIESVDGDISIDSLSLMPFDNIYGMRKDTLDLLKELNSPFYRWPGGNFVSGYDFYDGIGDRDKRPTKRNLNYCGQESDFADDSARLANDLMKIGELGFYGAFEPNDFGLDEFIQMCKYLNAEPNIVLNAGLGDAQMAKDEVEYCNGVSGEYALKRPQKEPYNVKYFSIGNEMNGDWQLGHMPIGQYVKKHNEFATQIKSVDPNIKIIAVGDNHTDWSSRMVDACKDNMNYLSEHYYAERKEADVKEHILSLKNQTTMRITNHRNIANVDGIKMSIDEYAYLNAETSSRLKDGMGVASALNEMIKNSDVVDIACYSSTINATQGNISTDDFKAYMEGSGYVLSLYRNNMQNHYLPIKYKSNLMDDYYEISGTINDDKSEITLSVINTSDNEIKVTSDKFKKIYSMDTLYGDYLESINNNETNELYREKVELNSNEAIIKPKSVSLIKIEI